MLISDPILLVFCQNCMDSHRETTSVLLLTKTTQKTVKIPMLSMKLQQVNRTYLFKLKMAIFPKLHRDKRNWKLWKSGCFVVFLSEQTWFHKSQVDKRTFSIILNNSPPFSSLGCQILYVQPLFEAENSLKILLLIAWLPFRFKHTW